MIEWITRKWLEWRTTELCGKRWGGDDVTAGYYCTRKHNHRGHHKEKRK